MKYFAHDYENGIEFFDTEEEAKAKAEEWLDLASDHAGDWGWDENVYDICWGKVSQKVERTGVEKAPDGSEFKEFWSFALVK